jgi:hypothetical protein
MDNLKMDNRKFRLVLECIKLARALVYLAIALLNMANNYFKPAYAESMEA